MSLGLVRAGMARAGFSWDHDVLYLKTRCATQDERNTAEWLGYEPSDENDPRATFSEPNDAYDYHASSPVECWPFRFAREGDVTPLGEEETDADSGAYLGHLYFMRNEEGLIKIGRSIRPNVRRSEVSKAEGCRVDLMVVVKDSGHLEKALHRAFAGYRVRGEWFRPCDDLVRLVADLGRLRGRMRWARETHLHEAMSS